MNSKYKTQKDALVVSIAIWSHMAATGLKHKKDAYDALKLEVDFTACSLCDYSIVNGTTVSNYCDVCPSKIEFLNYAKPNDRTSASSCYCEINDTTPWRKWFMAKNSAEKKLASLEMVELLNRSLNRINGEQNG